MMNVSDSERLQFQLMTADDAELLFKLDQDPEVLRYITNGRVTPMDEIHSKYIPRMQSYTDVDRGWGLWKTSIVASGDFIGWILIRPKNFFTDERDDRHLEIGWRFLRSAWGSGYATEAARAVMQAIEATGQYDGFFATAMVENTASTNIMEKLGMQHTNNYIHSDENGDFDCVWYERAVASIANSM